ncbi:hypothetical protein BO71DRAFT_393786 [Aspergillus ellipticus CBS 707.79]|uniref:Uncharacterized protein n=1 Tax=Aspergillus ellipticus CBS 707.79 TaxID=1448320 RepID=A0A319DRH3_9EURO|nr:hypothetical protein BO71DRAFT_393786 [Aspergillus ellipticus CBS 707.79]
MKKLLRQIYRRQEKPEQDGKSPRKSKPRRSVLWRMKSTTTTANIEAIDTPPFPFLSLPREIRDLVYRELLTVSPDGGLWIRYSRTRRRWWDATPYCPTPEPSDPRPRVSMAILLTCKTLREEALPILFNSNQVWLDGPPTQCLQSLSSLPSASCSGIRYLKLWMDAYLDCGRRTGFLPDLAPEEKERHQGRVDRELVAPWLDIFTHIENKMPQLHTLHIQLGPNRSWHARSIGSVSPEWQQFFAKSRIEKVREMMQITTLRVDASLDFCHEVQEREWEPFRDLRSDLRRVRAFEEVSVEWDQFFFLCSASEQFPETDLCFSLRRRRVEEGTEAEERRTPDPLPEYRAIHSLEDAVFPMVCSFGTGMPPRSPSNNRW